MPEDAVTKAKRRRRIRESFASPLNEIALRHVDSVQALSEAQRGILANVLQKTGPRFLANCIDAIKNHGVSIKDEDDLIKWLESSAKPQSDSRGPLNETLAGNFEDEEQLAKLLLQCYPDMPQSSADALVASDVMSASLHVVVTTRQALEDAKSDFVITVLYTLFEERLNVVAQLINNNPAFVKAIHRSRPDWKTKN